MFVALTIVFMAGWLFGADYPPPHTKDISAAGWMVAAVGAVMMAAMVASAGGHRQ